MVIKSLTISLRSKDGEWIEKPLGLDKSIIGRSANVDYQLDDYGSAFRGGVIPRMLYIAAITLAQFLMMLILMKRKDTI
ncbi:MAG: hypothetical protein K8R40_07670 [Anaerolineaceae bacterium]|nr:hypothetical protein [Anaerolineaceae bacterium]